MLRFNNIQPPGRIGICTSKGTDGHETHGLDSMLPVPDVIFSSGMLKGRELCASGTELHTLSTNCKYTENLLNTQDFRREMDAEVVFCTPIQYSLCRGGIQSCRILTLRDCQSHRVPTGHYFSSSCRVRR